MSAPTRTTAREIQYAGIAAGRSKPIWQDTYQGKSCQVGLVRTGPSPRDDLASGVRLRFRNAVSVASCPAQR